MEVNWDNDYLCIVINKADLPVDKDIVDAVWQLAQQDDEAGVTVARFLVLGFAIMFKGVLQFLR